MERLQAVDGKKTYVVAVLTVVWAFVGLYLGKVDVSTFFNYLIAAGAMFGFRSALNK